jgi:hypothetical protein
MLTFVLIFPVFVKSQQITPADSLLNRMAGRWVLRGTIDGQETIHDIDAKRVLHGQYLEFSEVSREKDSMGKPKYEANVYLCWQEAKKEYFCLWLDNTSNEGITNQIVGHAKYNGDNIELVFKYNDTVQFHTTFQYHRVTDTWEWIMDGDENGKLTPFARVKLMRNQASHHDRTVHRKALKH